MLQSIELRVAFRMEHSLLKPLVKTVKDRLRTGPGIMKPIHSVKIVGLLRFAESTESAISEYIDTIRLLVPEVVIKHDLC